MNRPRIIVNAAMSVDGKIALPNRKQLRISSNEDMKRVFQLRNECDAVLVGIGAVLEDDPKLTVKEEYVSSPKQPVRVVLDSYAQTPENALVVNDWAETILLIAETVERNKSYGDHVELLRCPEKRKGFLDLSVVFTKLYERGIKTVLIEGGGTVIYNVLSHGLVDELYVYMGSIIIGGKKTPTLADGEGIESIKHLIQLTLIEMKRVGNGVLLHYQLSR